jgi:hypothetical protein
MTHRVSSIKPSRRQKRQERKEKRIGLIQKQLMQVVSPGTETLFFPKELSAISF